MPSSVYKLEVNNTLKSAWQRVGGSKKTFWSAIPIMILTSILFNMLASFFKFQPFFHFIVQVVGQIVVFLFQLGLIYMGIQRAMDLPIQHNMLYRSYEHDLAMKATGLYFLQLLILFPFFLMGVSGAMYALKDLPGFTDPNNPNPFQNVTLPIFFNQLGKYPVSIALLLFSFAAIFYFGTRMSMAVPFLVDKKIGPGQAVSASFKATRSNFWRIFAVFFSLMCLLFFAFFPSILTNLLFPQKTVMREVLMSIDFILLLLAYVWLVPFAYIIIGTIYRKLLANAMLI